MRKKRWSSGVTSEETVTDLVGLGGPRCLGRGPGNKGVCKGDIYTGGTWPLCSSFQSLFPSISLFGKAVVFYLTWLDSEGIAVNTHGP